MTEYRYTLRRIVNDDVPSVLNWVMLNPSTADEVKDDQTIRKVKGFTQRAGYGSLTVTNLFAARCTDPNDLLKIEDPVGERNEKVLKIIMEGADAVVFAWGAWWHSIHVSRRLARLNVEGFAKKLGVKPLCLGLTQGGQPRHPLTLAYTEVLRPYDGIEV